jgi:hypothetical protein
MVTTWKEAAKRLNLEKCQRRPAAAGGGGAAAGEAMVPAPTNAPVGRSRMYLMDLEAAINTILKCPTFKNSKEAEPLRISQGGKAIGIQSIFDVDDCTVALSRENRYIAAGNFWWQNLQGSQTPGVPLRKSRVMDLACHLFALNLDWKVGEPLAHLPHLQGMIVVLVESAAQVAKHNLPRVSPDEVAHALVVAGAHEVAAGVPVERWARWRAIFLSCCFCFERSSGDGCPTDAAYWKAFNLRQS